MLRRTRRRALWQGRAGRTSWGSKTSDQHGRCGTLQTVIGAYCAFGDLLHESLNDIAILAESPPRPGPCGVLADWNVDFTNPLDRDTQEVIPRARRPLRGVPGQLSGLGERARGPGGKIESLARNRSISRVPAGQSAANYHFAQLARLRLGGLRQERVRPQPHVSRVGLVGRAGGPLLARATFTWATIPRTRIARKGRWLATPQPEQEYCHRIQTAKEFDIKIRDLKNKHKDTRSAKQKRIDRAPTQARWLYAESCKAEHEHHRINMRRHAWHLVMQHCVALRHHWQREALRQCGCGKAPTLLKPIRAVNYDNKQIDDVQHMCKHVQEFFATKWHSAANALHNAIRSFSMTALNVSESEIQDAVSRIKHKQRPDSAGHVGLMYEYIPPHIIATVLQNGVNDRTARSRVTPPTASWASSEATRARKKDLHAICCGQNSYDHAAELRTDHLGHHRRQEIARQD